MHIPRNVRAAGALYPDGLDDEADDGLRDRLIDLIRSDPQVRRLIVDVVGEAVKAQTRATSMAPRGGRRG
jgi:hypothetical protein